MYYHIFHFVACECQTVSTSVFRSNEAVLQFDFKYSSQLYNITSLSQWQPLSLLLVVAAFHGV